MAPREFHATILNEWTSKLQCSRFHDVDSGEWQHPFEPYNPVHAGIINPDETKEWRSESDGLWTGTSGWARWAVIVEADTAEPEHREWIQVNWGVPFFGRPDVTCGVFRDPDDDPSPAAPVLEIVPVAIDPATGRPVHIAQANRPPQLADVAQIAPYVLGVPWTFALDIWFVTHPRYAFIVRRRSPAPPLPHFATSLPSAEVEAMEAFRNRAKAAWMRGHVGGFPNFHEAMQGQNIVGGTVFVKSSTAEWHDVPSTNLGNPPIGNFAERMRASNSYATTCGYVGAFPTFYHAENVRFLDAGSGRRGYRNVYGTVLLKSSGAEWRDIPQAELGNPNPSDIGARFRATHEYAQRNGFVGGFPTMFDGTRTTLDAATGRKHIVPVSGAVLLKSGHAIWEDVVLSTLPH